MSHMNVEGASEAQKKYIRDLLEQRQGVPEAEEIRIRLNAMQEGGKLLSRHGAIAAIDTLKGLPKADQAASGDPDPGYYAIVPAYDPEGPLRFYRVTAGKGRWDGHLFVNVQAGDEWHPLNPGARADVLKGIAKDPEAAQRYGTELGRCSECNRILTDETSRALGIGPECRSKK